MNSIFKAAAGFAAVVTLSACVEDTGSASGGASTSMPSAAEQACLRDVTRTTNNGDVVLLSSEFSQAGTQVIVGVGPQRARWSCIAYSDGTTAGITSLTNEGTL
ncbi:hypothetical protein [Cognatishimia sp. F0-27]|uniref:hypothetical protein n=1 Tax=Cognatishimia sp. F0-27 TaxID=2816855 RepID=UPI001D0C89FE|nr:hypothetical protein [Cognatishimia sp. F0-27]MCC1494526.1 hypothetical protein [Cognatishimia sp. F0-27]